MEWEAHVCCPLVAALPHFTRSGKLRNVFRSQGSPLYSYKDLMLLRTYYVPRTALGAGIHTQASLLYSLYSSVREMEK